MLKKIIKFGVTGGLGTLTNLVIFFLLVDVFKFNSTLSSVICFFISCSQNYCINHVWTFKVENEYVKLSLKLWGKFLFASLTGLIINLCVLNILLFIREWQFQVIAQGIAILAGMISNFIFSYFFVFKGENNDY